MLPSMGDALVYLLTFAVAFAVVVAAMPSFMRFLVRRGRVAPDVHKPGPTSVPTPAGPLLVAALVAGEVVVFLAYRSVAPIAVIGVVVIACLIGVYDDLRGLGGLSKPALMMLAAAPMLAVEAFDPSLYSARLYFPLFTNTGTHLVVFALIVIASMPVASNAFNMLDAFNGEIAGFTLIASVAIVAAMLLRSTAFQFYAPARIAVAVPLVAVSLGFYIYNRYPSKVFDGDSGSLALGAMYASLAFIGGVELAALVAVIPAILNSYYVLSSVRGFVERKRMAVRPTRVGEDGRLHASLEKGSPTTLARMILLGGAMGERELVRHILEITVFAAALSVITSVMTWLL